MNTPVYLAFLMTCLAGLATTIGGALALHPRLPQQKVLPFGLAFAAGIMLYVSGVELLPEAGYLLASLPGHLWLLGLAFALGALFMAAMHSLFSHSTSQVGSTRLMRTGWLTALAIALHNFPEGFATLMTTLTHPTLGATLAFAVALHNIPEGMAVAIPIYSATGNRRRAFWMAAVAGLFEPLGALCGFLLLQSFFSDTLLGLTLALTAGVMVFISLDELLPTARAHDPGRLTLAGTLAGMGVMAASLSML